MKKIPPFNELPLISGAQLVKLTPVTYLDASRERIFEELVPEQMYASLFRFPSERAFFCLVRKR